MDNDGGTHNSNSQTGSGKDQQGKRNDGTVL
jgi:hypothetical protein